MIQAIGFNIINCPTSLKGQEDYGSLSLNVTFTPDEFEKSVQVPIINDTSREGSEVFYGNLMTSYCAVITAAATIEISSNDCKSPL